MKYLRSMLALAVVAALSLNVAFAGGDKCKDKDCCKTKTEKTSSEKTSSDKASSKKTSKKSAKSSIKSAEEKKS